MSNEQNSINFLECLPNIVGVCYDFAELKPCLEVGLNLL